jgi:hypothetical protein
MTSTKSKSKIERLNNSFVSWLEKQSVAHPLSIWSGGLQDYLNYAKKISEEAPAPLSDATQSSNQSNLSNTVTDSSETKKLESFSLPKQPPTAVPTTVEAPKPFSFVTKPLGSVGAPSSTGFSFGPKPTAPPSTNGATNLGGFSGFGTNSTSMATPQFGSFGGAANSFSKPKVVVEGLGGGGGGGGGGGDDEGGEGDGEEVQQLEPVEILRNEKDTDEILFEIATKLFRFDKGSGEWKDIGKGTLRVTRDTTQPSAKKRILIRNNMGKISLNANIFKGMGVKQSGKNGIQFFVPDETSTIHLYLIKVKPEDLERTLNFISQIEKSL